MFVCVCREKKESFGSFLLFHFVKSFCLVKLDVQVTVSFSLPLFLWLSVHHAFSNFIFSICAVWRTERVKEEFKDKETEYKFPRGYIYISITIYLVCNISISVGSVFMTVIANISSGPRQRHTG